MLGAKAREAEYNAFKAASARQATRAAEELKLPPRPAPISLSAFTRNIQTNRNKGVKAWKPLVLEDSPEDGEHDSTDHESGRSTPLEPINNESDARIELSASHVPRAPRAMLSKEDRPVVLANPAPKRAVQHSLIDDVQLPLHPAQRELAPMYSGGLHPYPYPTLFWPYPYQQVPYLTPVVPLGSSVHRQYGNFTSVMVPEDISPSKQEEKLATLKHMYGDPYGFTTRPNDQNPSYITQHIAPRGNTFLDVYGNTHFVGPTNPFESFDRASQVVVGDSRMPQLQVPYFVSEPGPATTDRNEVVVSSGTTRLDRYQSCLGEADMVDSFRTAQTTGPTTNEPPMVRSVPTSNCSEPYDRERQMQRFVATQHAEAKKAKTVLNNPELHKTHYQLLAQHSPAAGEVAEPVLSTSSRPSIPAMSALQTPGPNAHNRIPSNARIFASNQGEHWSPPGERDSSGRGLARPPPGLHPDPDQRQIDVFAAPASSNPASATRNPPAPRLPTPRLPTPRLPASESALSLLSIPAWNPKDPYAQQSNYGTEDWFFLEPVTTSRRKEMLEITQKFLYNYGRTDLEASCMLSCVPAQRDIEFQHIFLSRETDTPRVASIAREYSNGKMVQSDNDAVSSIDIGKSTVRVVGQVIANIAEYDVQARRPMERKDFFAKFKPAPEYAIERRSTSSSLFEEDDRAYFKAPSRIARDPRFRPHLQLH